MNHEDHDRPTGELLRSFAQHGSAAAFGVLVRRFTALVYHTALRRTGNEALAADVVQEVFIALARQAPALRADDRLGAWLQRRALFSAANLLRSETRRRQRETTAAAMNTAEPAPPAHWQEAAAALDPALHALPAKDREAIVLRYLEGRNLTEVGGALRVSKDAAQKRISRALERLHTLLTRRGVSLSLAGLVHGLTAESGKAAPAGLAAKAHAAGLAGLAKGGLAVSFFRWWPALRSGLAGAAGGFALCAVPLAMQQRTIAALEGSVPPSPSPVAALPPASPPPALAVNYNSMSLEELIAQLAALLEGDLNAMDALRLQAMMETVAPDAAAAALVLLEQQLSPRARARSETHGVPVRCAFLRTWAAGEPLAALENLVSRFDPGQPRELPADGEWLGGNWFDTAESCFVQYAGTDKAAATRWFFTALRSGRLDYQRGGEFPLLNTLSSGLDLLWYDTDPHLVIDTVVECINRNGSQYASGSLLSRNWDSKNADYKIQAAQSLTSPKLRKEMTEALEAQRLYQWITSDLPRAREWLVTQPEDVQRKHFATVVFPEYESRPLDKQGSNWTPHIEWALKARPGDCTEEKLPALLRSWLHHDTQRSTAWLCAHTQSAAPLKVVTEQMVRKLRSRQEDMERTASDQYKPRHKVHIATTLEGALTVAREWQRRDPAGAGAAAADIARILESWPSLRQPVLSALQP